MPVAEVTIGIPVGVVEELPSASYVWRIHYDSAAKLVLAPLTDIANEFIDAFEAVTGLDYIDLYGEDVAAGEVIPPSGYKLWWTDNPEVTVIPYAHYDLVLKFKVSSPIDISTLIGIAGLILLAYIVWQIVSTILKKVPPVVGLGWIVVGGVVAYYLLKPRKPREGRW